MVRLQLVQHKVIGPNSFWGHTVEPYHVITLSPPSNDELYKSSLIQVLGYLDIADGTFQAVLEHLPHSLLVPKYNRLDYILTNPPNSRAYYKLSWIQG